LRRSRITGDLDPIGELGAVVGQDGLDGEREAVEKALELADQRLQCPLLLALRTEVRQWVLLRRWQ
jgi:hypothetical protein